MEQISLKIPVRLLKELKEYAYRKGETPVSYHIRQAIAEYLENHEWIYRLNRYDTFNGKCWF